MKKQELHEKARRFFFELRRIAESVCLGSFEWHNHLEEAILVCNGREIVFKYYEEWPNPGFELYFKTPDRPLFDIKGKRVFMWKVTTADPNWLFVYASLITQVTEAPVNQPPMSKEHLEARRVFIETILEREPLRKKEPA